MAKREREVTWLEVAVRNAGIRKAMTATTWAYCWAITREAIGHDPSVEEVADWWKTSRATAFREQAAFRQAFPTLESPAAIYDSPEVRASLGRTAAAAESLDAWIAERRKRRETDAVRVMTARAVGLS